MNDSILVCTDSSSLAHDTGDGHPERADRLRALEPVFDALDPERFTRIDAAPPATEVQLEAVHTQGHIERVRAGCAAGPSYLDPDTHVVPASWDAALRATGGAVDAALRVARGESRRAFCAFRPPGHHAESNRSMGFCLFNSIAVAARALQEEGHAAKVAIVDFDVHHGNGTQEIFWEDPTVLYASCHQSPCYPGTGGRGEEGAGPGRGFTLNRPLTPGSGDEQILHWAAGELAERLGEFAPDFLLLSAGFDAHKADPLAQLEVSAQGFGQLSAIMVALADELCGGQLISLLEGGYDIESLSESVAVHLLELGRVIQR
jgi:acetoin utilization deacetylase AcuC-like enzyme